MHASEASRRSQIMLDNLTVQWWSSRTLEVHSGSLWPWENVLLSVPLVPICSWRASSSYFTLSEVVLDNRATFPSHLAWLWPCPSWGQGSGAGLGRIVCLSIRCSVSILLGEILAWVDLFCCFYIICGWTQKIPCSGISERMGVWVEKHEPWKVPDLV